MTHDFKGVIEHMNNHDPYDQIAIIALRIADRLQDIVSGDELTTVKMDLAGSDAEGAYEDIFKAMVAQMIKECEDDL